MSTPAERRLLAEHSARVKQEQLNQFASWEHDPKMRDAWLKLEKLNDTSGHFITWPASQRTRLLSKHMSYTDRFQLTLFALVNGVVPVLYAEYLIARGSLKDMAARNHVAGLIDAHMRNGLAKYTAWHVDRQDFISAAVPKTFDLEPPVYKDGVHWETAVSLLRGHVFRPVDPVPSSVSNRPH